MCGLVFVSGGSRAGIWRGSIRAWVWIVGVCAIVVSGRLRACLRVVGLGIEDG